jgi:hypothetical protein
MGRETEIWHSFNYPLGLSIYTIYSFIIIGFGLMIVLYKVLVITFSLNDICKKLDEKKAFILNPFSHDKSSVLKILAVVSIWIFTLALIPLFMATVGVATLGLTQVTQIMIPAYIIFLCLVFFYPLFSAHQLMIHTKDRTIFDLSKKVNTIYNKYYTKLNNLSSEDHEKAEYKINTLSNIHQRLSSSPEWPFNMKNISQGAIGLILALFPLLFEYI